MRTLAPVDFSAWIKEIEPTLQPPVANRLLYGDGQLKVMVVGGPNQREDHHLEFGEEVFFQIKGKMHVDIVEKQKKKRIEIPEGDIFLLPGRVPHSPQRYENTMGLVIERERKKEEIDGLMWFAPNTTKTLYEEYFYCTDLGTQLKPVIERYFASESFKTKSLEHAVLHPNPPITPDPTISTVAPFSLHNFYKNLMKEAPSGFKNIFMSEFQVFFVWGDTSVDLPVVKTAEVFAWQHQGSSTLQSKAAGTSTELPAGHVHLMQSHETVDGVISMKSSKDGMAMLVTNVVLPN